MRERTLAKKHFFTEYQIKDACEKADRLVEMDGLPIAIHIKDFPEIANVQAVDWQLKMFRKSAHFKKLQRRNPDAWFKLSRRTNRDSIKSTYIIALYK